MLYGKYINLSNKANKPSNIELPKHEEFIYYFGIYFPWRKQYILGNIHSIYILSGILIFVVLFLGYALIVILQQKRFSELQKEIVNNLTHEFKTPLSSILLSTDVLNEKGIVKEPERVSKYAQIINSQAKALLHHVEKILGMSELENIGQLNKKQIVLDEFLKNIIDSIAWRINNKNGEINLDLNSSDQIICADVFHLTNLILNLIDNAIKYCEQEPNITISTQADKKHLFLTVKDKGAGIDKKYHKKIFKKFFRIPTGNIHNVKGFGLGLSYVKDIVKNHRWKLKLHSELNQGTEIVIVIPLKNTDCE